MPRLSTSILTTKKTMIMKKIIAIIALAFACSTVSFAQTTTKEQVKQIIKDRKEIRKMTEKQIDAKALKEAKAQAKIDKKAGWMPCAGTATLEKQQTEVYLRKSQLKGNFSRYIFGSGQAVAKTEAIARKQALTRARVDIASNLKTEVAALTESTESNTELSNGDVETITKWIDTSKVLAQQTLGRTETIYEAYRKTDVGVEVHVIVTYDGQKAMDTLLQSFGEDQAELKAKLENLLNE